MAGTWRRLRMTQRFLTKLRVLGPWNASFSMNLCSRTWKSWNSPAATLKWGWWWWWWRESYCCLSWRAFLWSQHSISHERQTCPTYTTSRSLCNSWTNFISGVFVSFLGRRFCEINGFNPLKFVFEESFSCRRPVCRTRHEFGWWALYLLVLLQPLLFYYNMLRLIKIEIFYRQCIFSSKNFFLLLQNDNL